MEVYPHKAIKIEVMNESTYSFNSTDNVFMYSRIYLGDDTNSYIFSQYGIKVSRGEEIIGACLIVTNGGGTTGIHDQVYLNRE